MEMQCVKKKTAMMPLDELYPHPSRVIYLGDVETEATARLQDDIAEFGLFEPIEALSDGRILSGARRWMAVRELGYEAVETWVREDLDCDEIAAEKRVLTANRQRPLSDLAELRSLIRVMELNLNQDADADEEPDPLYETMFKMTVEAQVLSSLGLSDESLARYLLILTAPPEVLVACQNNELSLNEVEQVAECSADDQLEIVKAIGSGMLPNEAVEMVVSGASQNAGNSVLVGDNVGCGSQCD